MNVQIQKESTKILKKIIKKSPSKVDAFIYLFPQNFLNTADLNFLYNKTGSPILVYDGHISTDDWWLPLCVGMFRLC